MRALPFAAAAAILGAALPARADDAPIFATLDRTADGDQLRADVSTVLDNSPAPAGATATHVASRLDLHGQISVDRDTGIMLYGNLALSRAFDSRDPDGDLLGIGNAELGVAWRGRLARDLDIAAHVGMTLPTASDDELRLANTMTAYTRLADVALTLPDTTWARLGTSLTWHRGGFHLRGDVGVDVGMDSQPNVAGETVTFPTMGPLVHANLGLGYTRGKLTAFAELVSLLRPGALLPGTERLEHTAAIGASYQLGPLTPFVAVTAPIASQAEGRSAAFMLGVRGSF